jgi:Zn/Cd-binding protein ZinT
LSSATVKEQEKDPTKTPEASLRKAALREMMGSYLKENNVKVQDGTDVNSIMRDMMSITLEGALDQEMEEKIISMYAKRMTTNDIESHMRELYDIEISDSTISRITDKILPTVKEWQERPLEEIYAVVFMDAIHYHVRNEGRISAGNRGSIPTDRDSAMYHSSNPEHNEF